MNTHMRVVCEHGALIRQCRCPGPRQERVERPCPFPDHGPSRPVPVPGQAAREAAVEAVARWLHSRGRDSGTPWYVWAAHHQDRLRKHARELLSLPAVAALSAAPGQEQLDAVLKLHQAEDTDQVGGERQRMCVECIKPAPCPTVLAATGQEQP